MGHRRGDDVRAGGAFRGTILLMAGLYSLGAHGIMTLNDFKAIEGDRRMGVRSLPVQLGLLARRGSRAIVMIVPQLA